MEIHKSDEENIQIEQPPFIKRAVNLIISKKRKIIVLIVVYLLLGALIAYDIATHAPIMEVRWILYLLIAANLFTIIFNRESTDFLVNFIDLRFGGEGFEDGKWPEEKKEKPESMTYDLYLIRSLFVLAISFFLEITIRTF